MKNRKNTKIKLPNAIVIIETNSEIEVTRNKKPKLLGCRFLFSIFLTFLQLFLKFILFRQVSVEYKSN